MKVIGVANQKGGCAKTTTAYQLSVDLKDRGNTVVLIDNDPQKGSLRWKRGAASQTFTPVVTTIENPLTQDDIAIFSGVDYVVIDGPPGYGNDDRLRQCHDFLNDLSSRDSMSIQVREEIGRRLRKIFGFDGTIAAKLTAILKLSDFMIIPTLASIQDLEPSFNIIRDIVAPYKERHGKPEYRVLVTDSDEQTKLYAETMKYMDRNQIPHFSTCIKHREIYRQAVEGGFTVIENNSNPKATTETKKVTDEILAFFEEK